MEKAPTAAAPSLARVDHGPDAGRLYEPTAAIRDIRVRRGWQQADLACIAGITRPSLSAIESGRVRVTAAKARAVSGALGVDVTDVFVPVLTASAAASRFGVDRQALVDVALDATQSQVTAHAVERRGLTTRVYFREDALREQLEQLPSCKAAGCDGRALRSSGYCADHHWRASHEVIRRAISKPVDERPWVTEDEACRIVGRSWDVVHRAALRGEVRNWKVGGCRIIPKGDLRRWDETLPFPGLRSAGWQAETDGMVGLYLAGKSSITIAARAKRNEKTVRARLRLRDVAIRPAVGPLARNWDTGTGAARAAVKRWDKIAIEAGTRSAAALRWIGKWSGHLGREHGIKGGAPVRWGTEEETAAKQLRILELDKAGLSSRDIAADPDVFGDERFYKRVLGFLKR